MYPSGVLRQVLGQAAKATRSRGDLFREAQQIILTNVPRTATPADIRREINKAGVKGVSDIALDYEFFRPTERAILTLVSPTYLKSNLDALKNLTISGIPVSSDSYVAEVQQERQRMRGHEGRLKAARRGALTGHGPNAGIVNNALTVTIAGLPARMTVDDLAYFLKDFDVAESGKGLPQILKLPLPPKTFSMTSRFLVTLTSIAEAHRLVRKLHASYIGAYGEDSLISARIIH